MALINQPIVENIEASYIETYFAQNGFKRSEDEKGIPVVEWVNSLISSNKISITNFEDFLFKELLLGKRKLIRIYKLQSLKEVKYPEDWLEILSNQYGIHTLNFKAILNTYVTAKEKRKIAAIFLEENDKGELEKLQILFVYSIQVSEAGAYSDSYAYVPVEIDFHQRIMTIKAWNRYNIPDENDRSEALLDHTYNIMALTFGISIRPFVIKHKKTLYLISKGLVEAVYNSIPAFSKISVLTELINNFEQEVYSKFPIVNMDTDCNGKRIVPRGVMDFYDEIKKALERLAISDYFYNRDYEEIWDMGVDTIIARIKFNDNENVLTSLSGEESEKPIFCTKTFMYLKKSMEDSKLVERLWIVKKRTKGTLNKDKQEERQMEIFLGVHLRR